MGAAGILMMMEGSQNTHNRWMIVISAVLQTVISNCHLTQTPIVFKIMLMENKQECDSTKMAHSSVNMEPLNATKCNKNIIKCLLTASTGIRTRVCATIHLIAAIFEMATELFRRHRRVLIKIIKITFIQNQLQAVPMSKVFEKSKKKRTRLQLLNKQNKKH